MRNPVESYKRKFDGFEKGPWRGDLVEETEDGWLVVFYDRPDHRARGAHDTPSVSVAAAWRPHSSSLARSPASGSVHMSVRPNK